MRALSLTHQELTREALLKKAEQIPGAWIGIRIAAFLLILSGWKSTHVAELFGLTRWAVVKWMRRANREGIEAVNDRPRPGRPSQFDEEVMKALDEALSKSPQDYGISRNRWDGIVVTEYLKRVRGNTDGFLNMLTRIVYRFRGRIIDLCVDNASWHKGPSVEQFLAGNPRLKLHYLPPYHPELNFQERLWRMMRYEETSSTYYEAVIHLEVAVFSRSQRWKPQKLKKLYQSI